MLLKILFLLIVFYLVVRTCRSLVRAIAQNGGASKLGKENDGVRARSGSSGDRISRHEDVEDAKYIDI